MLFLYFRITVAIFHKSCIGLKPESLESSSFPTDESTGVLASLRLFSLNFYLPGMENLQGDNLQLGINWGSSADERAGKMPWPPLFTLCCRLIRRASVLLMGWSPHFSSLFPLIWCNSQLSLAAGFSVSCTFHFAVFWFLLYQITWQ